MLYVIRDTEVGTKEIPNPQKLASQKYMRRRKQQRHLTTSEPNKNPIGAPISVTGS